MRSARALKLAIAEMYVQGVSTRRGTEITRELCGLDVTSTDVSRAAAERDAQLSAWRERPLGRCSYLILDARYEKVRHGGSVIDCAVLVAMGVREEDGKRTLLGVSLRQVPLLDIVNDDLPSLGKRSARLPGTRTTRRGKPGCLSGGVR